MKDVFFNIKYVFDKKTIYDSIEQDKHGYICLADGTVMRYVHQDMNYRMAVNGALFSISDSSWGPFFLKLIYGIDVHSYTGPQLFIDIVNMKKYRMFFLGADKDILENLRNKLVKFDSKISEMTFMELPFCDVDGFDYEGIASIINKDKPRIIWVSLGAPKQELFMSKLQPYLDEGVQIAVGAAFKFFSGTTKRPPAWVRKLRMVFLYRIFQEPRKQGKRCFDHVKALPSIIMEEWRNSKDNRDV